MQVDTVAGAANIVAYRANHLGQLVPHSDRPRSAAQSSPSSCSGVVRSASFVALAAARRCLASNVSRVLTTPPPLSPLQVRSGSLKV